MLLSQDKFGGIVPIILDPILIPPEKSQYASNCRFDRGGIMPLNRDLVVFTPPEHWADNGTFGTIIDIYRYRGHDDIPYWIPFYEKTEYVQTPTPNDSWNRLYATWGGALHVTDNEAFSTLPYPNFWRNPSPPPPPAACTVSASSSGTDPTLEETRYYVYTYVNMYGDEGPPSPVSNKIVVWDGNTVNISGMSIGAELGAGPAYTDYYLLNKRIYRVNQAAGTGASFQFVAEIGIGDATYTDTVLDASLGELLPSAEWDHAPDGIEGLIALPNATLAAFTGNTVCLSVPNYPHAWPVAYQKTVNWDIMALGSFGTTLVILTKGQPYYLVLTDPVNAVPEQVAMGMSCMSKRGRVQAGDLVIYPCPLGLAVLGPGVQDILTKDVIDKDTWISKYNPSTINAYYWNHKYVASFTNSDGGKYGFIYDLKTKDLIDLDFEIDAGWYNPEEGVLYTVTYGDNKIRSFCTDTDNYRFIFYIGKRHVFPASSLGAVKVLAKSYPVALTINYPEIPASADTLNVISKDIHRLTNVGWVEQCEIWIDSLTTEISAIFIASTPEELPL